MGLGIKSRPLWGRWRHTGWRIRGSNNRFKSMSRGKRKMIAGGIRSLNGIRLLTKSVISKEKKKH